MLRRGRRSNRCHGRCAAPLGAASLLEERKPAASVPSGTTNKRMTTDAYHRQDADCVGLQARTMVSGGDRGRRTRVAGGCRRDWNSRRNRCRGAAPCAASAAARERCAQLPDEHPRRGRRRGREHRERRAPHDGVDACADDPGRCGDAGCLPGRHRARDDPGWRHRGGRGSNPSRNAFIRHLLLDGYVSLLIGRPDQGPRRRNEAFPFRWRRSVQPWRNAALRCFAEPVRGQPLLAADDRSRDCALRNAGRRQPLLLCGTPRLIRRNCARDPSRFAQTRRAALQSWQGHRRALSARPVSGNAAA